MHARVTKNYTFITSQNMDTQMSCSLHVPRSGRPGVGSWARLQSVPEELARDGLGQVPPLRPARAHNRAALHILHHQQDLGAPRIVCACMRFMQDRMPFSSSCPMPKALGKWILEGHVEGGHVVDRHESTRGAALTRLSAFTSIVIDPTKWAKGKPPRSCEVLQMPYQSLQSAAQCWGGRGFAAGRSPWRHRSLRPRQWPRR